ncbi:hypothetical protein ACFSSC_02895 [Corynebacterium mendelii]|uniref:hypothetical protein n=1 Tax=Corynebacterium mendelii TaxID=2765362 RepID=UPI001F5C5831|nr:hypothetical protein [Corynebacterium mendelii]
MDDLAAPGAGGNALDGVLQWLVSAPLWLQAPLVFAVMLPLCGAGAVLYLTVIDVCAARLTRWRRRRGRATPATRTPSGLPPRTPRSSTGFRIVIDTEPTDAAGKT